MSGPLKLVYREIDHNAPTAEQVHALRADLAELLTEIVDLVHYRNVLGRGDQWTIPIAMSCGFYGEIVVRVADTGDCGSQGLRRSTTPS